MGRCRNSYSTNNNFSFDHIYLCVFNLLCVRVCACDIISTVCPFYDRPIEFITYSFYTFGCVYLFKTKVFEFGISLMSFFLFRFQTSSSPLSWSRFQFALATVLLRFVNFYMNSMSQFNDFHICSHIFFDQIFFQINAYFFLVFSRDLFTNQSIISVYYLCVRRNK